MWIAVHEKNALTDSKLDEKQVAWKLKNVLTSKYKYFLEKKVQHISLLGFFRLFWEKEFQKFEKIFKSNFFWTNSKFQKLTFFSSNLFIGPYVHFSYS